VGLDAQASLSRWATGERNVRVAVLTSFVIPGLTPETYDQMSDQFTPVALSYGMLLHAAGQVEGGWQMIEIWPSREALDRFLQEVVEPAMRQMGAPLPELTIAEAHNVVGLPT
jgi:hypothetical protein